jgi:hypothetical protein
MMPKKVRLFILLSLAFILGSCASIDHIYSLNYKRFAFSHDQLAREGVVILPLTFNYEDTAYIKTAQDIFLQSFKGLQKDLNNLIEPSQLPGLAKQGGFEEEYRQLLDTDPKKDTPKALLIRKVGRAVEKRFLLWPDLVSTRLADGATQLKLTARIWDVDTGEIVWDASEEARGYVILIFPQTPAPFEKVMEAASIQLIRKMP